MEIIKKTEEEKTGLPNFGSRTSCNSTAPTQIIIATL